MPLHGAGGRGEAQTHSGEGQNTQE
jgi:hypothetical protein